jgi:hypothetical protein
MALYKYSVYLETNTSEEFDKILNPGATTPHSGIYRCEGCGHEIASNADNPLPPQNHHQHTIAQGNIRWKMVVYSQGK